MALKVRLRAATPADAPMLAAIENECFQDGSWREMDFLRYECTVAEVIEGDRNPLIAGFIVSHETAPAAAQTPPEREILNLAVRTQFRRQGVAQQLLEAEVSRRAIFHLEVRASNTGALKLYEKAGFKQTGTRRNYYDNPVESAIVMSMKWC